MGPLLVVLLLTLILFGAGFTMKILWYVAVVLLIIWIAGFLTKGSGNRWYRW